jgi:hypothetical protein
MTTKTQEVLSQAASVEGPADIDIDGLSGAAEATTVLPRPRDKWEHVDLTVDNFNRLISRDGTEIGRVSLAGWTEPLDGANIRAAAIEDLQLETAYNNHSGYLAVLRQIVAEEPQALWIDGFPSNEMAAVTLDLDTLGLLPEGWTASYYSEEGGQKTGLQYPFEVYDLIKKGTPVFHILERIAPN